MTYPFPIWNQSVVPCPVVSQEAGQVVWYSHLFQNFPQLTRPQSRDIKLTFEKKLASFFRHQHCNSMINIYFFISYKGLYSPKTCLYMHNWKKNLWWTMYTVLTCQYDTWFLCLKNAQRCCLMPDQHSWFQSFWDSVSQGAVFCLAQIKFSFLSSWMLVEFFFLSTVAIWR